VIYVYEFVVIAEEETVLQGMIDRLSEVGERCGMESSVKKKLR
jgi:predicted nucleic acid-binding Zn ribbon protein